MTTPEGTWTVLSGGRRGTMTAGAAGLAVTFGDDTTTFGWSDDLRLEFPTSYSMRICEHDELRMALGFASTGEQQSFRRMLSPQSPPPEERTAVMSAPSKVTPVTPTAAITNALLGGVGVALLGWLLLGVFGDGEAAARFGAFLVWLGSFLLLAGVVAWGVKTGIEATRR